MYPDTFVEYMETSHLARFAIGRGSHAESPIPEDANRINDLTWTYYETTSMDGRPCIMVLRYDNTASLSEDQGSDSATKIIYLDTQDKDKLKEQLREAIEFIRKHLLDGFDIKV